MTEFNLSKHIWKGASIKLVGNTAQSLDVIPEEDVKEFIRLLKEEGLKEKPCFVDISCGEYEFDTETFIKFINKLAGEKLT